MSIKTNTTMEGQNTNGNSLTSTSKSPASAGSVWVSASISDIVGVHLSSLHWYGDGSVVVQVSSRPEDDLCINFSHDSATHTTLKCTDLGEDGRANPGRPGLSVLRN